jgi:hypothetical protein
MIITTIVLPMEGHHLPNQLLECEKTNHLTISHISLLNGEKRVKNCCVCNLLKDYEQF